MYEFEHKTEHVTDESIVDEAEKLRRHTEELQRLENKRAVDIEKIRAKDRQHRRHILTGVLVGLGVLLLLATCFAGCAYNANQCSEGGGVWSVDHCEIPE